MDWSLLGYMAASFVEGVLFALWVFVYLKRRRSELISDLTAIVHESRQVAQRLVAAGRWRVLSVIVHDEHTTVLLETGKGESLKRTSLNIAEDHPWSPTWELVTEGDEIGLAVIDGPLPHVTTFEAATNVASLLSLAPGFEAMA